MTLHTFGDSHSSDKISGWKMCKNVNAHHLRAVLCYSFGREKLNRCDIRDFGLVKNDSVVFCFGEIDCRCHVHKHINSEMTYQKVIDNIVDNYEEVIRINIKGCGVNLKYVCIYNVVPPVQKHNTGENPQYPYLGSDDERKSYVLYFNEQLKKRCERNSWVFFDVYDKYCDANGFLSKKYSDGNVHIRDGKYLQEFIDINLK